MKTVQVNASRNYEVIIGSGILSALGEHIFPLGNFRKVCIVSDTNVWPLYGETVTKSLTHAGYETVQFVFPAGEANKNGDTYLSLLGFLAERRLTRSDLVIGLGGGVVGDLAGFAAATYLRGVPFVQVPTTLLAAVDSSVGGKTAIDLPQGKNLAGAFYQPLLVLCDTDTLDTLPREIFLDGCAEVIKYGILFDPGLFSELEKFGPDFQRETVIARCVELKRDIVAQDEFDRGQRMLLNLGHTFGHCVETCSNYTVSHGKAVAVGIAMAARAAQCPDTPRIVGCLTRFRLPCATDFSCDTLLQPMLSDKKRSGGTVCLILPRSIGHCEIVPTPVETLKSMIQAGL